MKKQLAVFSWFLFLNPDFAFSQNQSAPSSNSLLNPQTSVNALTLYRRSKQQSGFELPITDNGFSLQEVELQFIADVDPYSKANALLSIHPGKKGVYEIEPEEVYAESTRIPYTTLKAGRFHAALGRHNVLHTHAFPFIDAPLINQMLLGDDGLTEVGVSASTFMPLPWYSEVIVQALQGQNTSLFASKDSNPIAWVGRVRNLFDLSEETTLDFGISGAYGRNQYNNKTTVQGVDLTLKWRPLVGGKYRALIVGTEFLQGDIRGRPDEPSLSGYSLYGQYQFAERWWVQARQELARDRFSSDRLLKVSALLAFFPSEFSALRLEYDQTIDTDDLVRHTVSLQGNYSIGAHPAHSY